VVNLGRKGERVLPSGKNSNVMLRENVVLTIITPGGGGFGPAKGRTKEALARDRQEEIVSSKK